jgi:hypothetical protein
MIRYRPATRVPGRNRPSSTSETKLRRDVEVVLRGRDSGAAIATVSSIPRASDDPHTEHTREVSEAAVPHDAH